MGIIAAGYSAPSPLSGQKNRSGPNFQLSANNKSTITLNVYPDGGGIVFDVKQDVTGSDPTPISNATNGTKVTGDTLATGKNYYIANPKHASADFVVTFTQS